MGNEAIEAAVILSARLKRLRAELIETQDILDGLSYDEGDSVGHPARGLAIVCKAGNGKLYIPSAQWPMQAALQSNDAGVAALIAALAVTQTGGATQATLASVLAKLSADPATQTTLAAVLAKLATDPATQTTLAAVLAKLSGDPATQTTLAAVLAKLSTDPSTATNQATLNTAMATLLAQTDQLEGYANTANAKLDTLHADLTPLAAGRWTTATLSSVGVASAAFDCTTYGLTRCVMQVNRNGATGVQIGLQASLDSSSPTHWFEIAHDAKANLDSAMTTVEMPVRWLRVIPIAIATGSGIQVTFGGFP